MVKRVLGDLDCEVEIEPGRLISGNAGILVTRTIYRKQGEDGDCLIVDAAMNELIRPAMYGSHHDIVPVVEPTPGRPGGGGGGEPGGGGGGGGGAGATPLLTSRVTMMPGIVCPPGVVPTTVPAEAVLLSELTCSATWKPEARNSSRALS